MENLLRDNKEKSFVFIDFETENLCLNECHNLPWEVSFIRYKNNKIGKGFDFYVKWPEGLHVSPRAAKITNFDPANIEKFGKSPEEVLDVLNNELEKADIIAGHNLLGFDTYVAQSFYRKLGLKPYNIVPKVLDTFPIAKAIKLEIPYKKNQDFIAFQYRLYHYIKKGIRCSLGALGKEFNIDHDYNTLHNALSDLQLNIKVWDKLKYMINIEE